MPTTPHATRKATKKSRWNSFNPRKLLNMTAKSIKTVIKAGSNISRRTIKNTRRLLKSADKTLARL